MQRVNTYFSTTKDKGKGKGKKSKTAEEEEEAMEVDNNEAVDELGDEAENEGEDYNWSGDEGEGEEEDNSTTPGKRKRPAKADLANKVIKHGVTQLMTLNVREHLNKLWRNNSVLLKRLYPTLCVTSSKHPMDIFFWDVIPVPPSRFRPVSNHGRELCLHLYLYEGDVLFL